jgi:hypothetical protein
VLHQHAFGIHTIPVQVVVDFSASDLSTVHCCLGSGWRQPDGPGDDRSAPFIMNLLANWSEESADVGNISWIRGLFNKLRPAMKPGVYITFISGDEQDRVPEAYQERWERMVAVKSPGASCMTLSALVFWNLKPLESSEKKVRDAL